MDKIFRIKGWFKKNKMEFTKEIPTHSEERAKELLYSELGSKHAVKRSLIEIRDIEEIEPKEAEDLHIREMDEE
ncbi:MAG: 50S ribosomal protein L18Ae [Candidatus Hadarchaeia archaeon]